MLLNDSLKKEINKVLVVSFDIFDTLLVRPYARPTDLFLHMEKVFHKPLFCMCRIEAEKNARLANPNLEDVSFDMIYNEIDDEFKTMKQKEMDWEKMVLRTNPELKQVYDYAKKQGKKIIIASDMYLPTDFIEEVLRENGYDGWDKLYVSGDVNARKGNGHLFKKIMFDMKIKPQEILHIGDNKASDFKIPLKLKMNAKLYKTIYEQYIKSNKSYEQLKNILKNSLGLSIISAVMSYNWKQGKYNMKKENCYWQDLGYQYAGPVSYGYTRFIEKVAKDNNIDSLLFVARDGYLLQKIFNLFSPDIANAYIYAPRFLNHICRLDYIRKSKEQAQSIIDFYAEKDERAKKLATTKNKPHEIIQQNKKLFGELADKQMKLYKNYLLSSIPQGTKYALVDTITGEFSSQKIIEAGLSQEILGIYWGICDDKHIHKYEQQSFIGVHTPKDAVATKYFFTSNWNFMEFLITSPEHPIKNIDEKGQPIYAAVENDYEIKRAKLYPDIVEGALSFTQDIQAWFKGHDIFITATDIVNWVNAYIEYPKTFDIKQMMDIRIGEDSAHQIWSPLFLTKIKLLDFIKYPQKTIKIIKKSTWRTPLQSLIICISKPFSIRTRGTKKIAFMLFPYLKKQYFILSLKLGQRWIYQFVIGNIKS